MTPPRSIQTSESRIGSVPKLGQASILIVRCSHFPLVHDKSSNLSLEQWMKAFHLYMSVFIMQPANLPSTRKILKYMQVIQNLYEQGGSVSIWI